MGNLFRKFAFPHFFMFILCINFSKSADFEQESLKISPSHTEKSNQEDIFFSSQNFQKLLYDGPKKLVHPTNISGLYKGFWFPESFESNSLHQYLNFSKSSGNSIFQFQSKILDAKTHLLHGSLRLRDGFYTVDQSVHFHLFGVYFPQNGEAFLIGNLFDFSKNPFEISFSDFQLRIQKIMKLMEFRHKNMPKQDFSTLMDEIFTRGSLFFPAQPFDAKQFSVDISLFFKFEEGFQEASSQPKIDPIRADAELNETMSNRVLHGFIFGNAKNDQENCKTVNFSVFAGAQKLEDYFQRVYNYVFLFSLVTLLEIRLFYLQIQHTLAGNRSSRVSPLFVVMLAFLDTFFCILHMTAAFSYEAVSRVFLFAAFLKFLLFSGIELQYLMVIKRSQQPQPHPRIFLLFSYAKIYLVLISGVSLLFVFLSLAPVFLFFLYSFWIPQIVLNSFTDITKSINYPFLIGTSLAKLFIPLYFFACPSSNIIPQNYPLVFLLLFWVALQVLILILQDFYGARFFIAPRFLPQKYNYHRAIHFSAFLEKDPQTGLESIDCVICMSPIDQNFADYMVTPCNHLFHPKCLQQWMDIKMECPTCRRDVPPP